MKTAGGGSGAGLHVVVLVDQSGSMLGDGKMQSVNAALEESLPHLEALARQNPMRVDIVAFATDAALHQSFSLPDHGVVIDPVETVRQGLTETGVAIAAAIQLLDNSTEASVVVLVSDGRATDVVQPSFEQALGELQASSMRVRTLSLALGRDANVEAMLAFTKLDDDLCTDAMQMVGRLRRILAEVERGPS